MARSEEDQKVYFSQIISAAAELGWMLSIPDTGEDGPVVGLIIGIEPYVEGILEHIPKDFADQFK